MEEPTNSLSGEPQGPDGDLRSWGPFRIVEKLGHGAFGEVYRAWDAALAREVALKILRPTAKGDDYKSVRAAIDALNEATMRLAELMMDSAVSEAIKGQTMQGAGEKLGSGPSAPHPIAPAEFEHKH